MKKYLIIVSVLALASVSCQKNREDATIAESSSDPIHVELTATIGADTKISFVEEDNVLKTAWEEGDQVSVIALDISSNVISNDIFTAQSSGKSTVFSGTFTNDDATRYVRVFYPALTQGDGENDPGWYSAPADGYSDVGSLYSVKKGSCYLDYSYGYQLQQQDGDYSHLDNHIVLSGDVDVEDLMADSWEVVLDHRSYVLKCELTFPDEAMGQELKHLDINVYAESGVGVPVSGSGWTTISEDEYFPGGWDTEYLLNFGEEIYNGTGAGMVLQDNVVTVYMAAFSGISWNYNVQESRRYQLSVGDYMKFTATTEEDGNEYFYVLDKKTVTKQTILENGKMYRLSATLEKKVEE